MPNNISQNLETVSPASMPTAYGESGSEAAGIVQGITQGIQQFAALRKANVLGKVASEAQSIVTESASYQQAKDNIVANMRAADKAQFDRLSTQLERLRKGEVQGVISPQAANTRLQVMAKTYINRYPRMAGEIRQMLKLISGDIAPDTKSADISDPVLKAQYDLVEEATKRGVTPQEQIAFNRTKDNVELSRMQLEKAQLEGSFAVPKLMFDLVDNKTSEVFAELITGMTNRIKVGGFNKENELTGLLSSQAQAVVDLNKQLTDYELEHGVRVDHAQFEARLKSAYDPLIQLAGAADSVDKQKRLVTAQSEILKATDYQYLHKVLGAFAPMVAGNPEQGFKLMDQISTTIKQIKQGQLPSLEAAAQYDPKTRMILDLLKNNGQGWDVIASRMNDSANGVAPKDSSGSPIVDKLSNKILADLAAKPGTPIEESGKLLANLISSGRPGFIPADPIEAVLYNKRVHSILAKSPTAQEALNQSVLQELTAYVLQTPMSDIRDIEVDMSDMENPFKYKSKIGPSNPSYGFVDNMNFDGMPVPAYQTNNFANKMNQFSRLMSLYKNPNEIQEELLGKFEELINTRVKTEMQSLADLQGRGPHQADKQAGKQTVTEVNADGSQKFRFDPNSGQLTDSSGKEISPGQMAKFTPEEIAELEQVLQSAGADSTNPDDYVPAE